MAFASDKTRQGAAGQGAASFTIDNSCRFNDNDSAYLSRTFGTATNRKKWTWSGWVKRGNLTDVKLFSAGTGSLRSALQFSSNSLRMYLRSTGNLVSTALFRDPSAWYHIVVAVDTTISSPSSDRIKMYVNGAQITDLSSSSYPNQNAEFDINNNVQHGIGRYEYGPQQYLDGYLSEVHFIDGQALTPSSFGETDATYGHWKPKEVTGMTYGTNGFYLDFADSSDLGNDVSGEGNDWTSNNLASTDQMLDTPTNNFCTLNPLMPPSGNNNQLLEGNLIADATSSTWSHAPATWSFESGKWYWEVAYLGTTSYTGVSSPTVANKTGNALIGWDSPLRDAWIYHSSGYIRHNGANEATVASLSAGDILGFAMDVDSGTLKFYKNDALIHTASDDFTGWYPDVGTHSTTYDAFNFGQDATFAGNKSPSTTYTDGTYGDFYYEPPSGYLALCTANLDDPAADLWSDGKNANFSVDLWTGNGSTQKITTNIDSEMVWGKRRNGDYHHRLYDIVRGTDLTISTNLTNAEGSGGLDSFDGDGFTVDATTNFLNTNGGSYVGWSWKANGSDVLNEDGTIDSQVSANTTAGFSIVSYTGTGTSGNIGHGLGKKPQFIVVKKRNAADGWMVYNEPKSATYYMYLNGTSAGGTSWQIWNDTEPTTDVFSVASNNDTNGNGDTYIAYCWAGIDGYSKVGSFEGNGNSDGTFVYTGFRPAYVMVKRTDGGANWELFDSERSAYNLTDKVLSPNLSNAEDTAVSGAVDFISNGFKPRGSSPSMNASGGNYIFIAFAETPFKYTNAR